ncbi:MAG: CHASE2 domain-containing protein [Desulfobacterales bacterium]|uniref:non-specific serine/threonine protein kinase n=1 Tax=Candidatus Desulfatibia profunda TaxID=2841695 RepID=A0A8J6TLE1_9BACT|nr:CHASE2 domain-containing protein [Candidatus Desulfatibia profunda]MBL7181003.1 CHASE2 domain-containing protein [Desulfobacterales bacterium]
MGILKRHPAAVLGLAITVIFLVLGVFRLGFLDTLELKFYDLMMNLRGEARSPSDVIVVDIDDDSIEKLGRWPWPRSLLAEGINKISAGKPRVIGLNFILSEPEESSGLKALRDLEGLFSQTILDQTGDKGLIFLKAMSEAQAKLDNDKKLTEALHAAGNVVLPVFFKASEAAIEGPAETDRRLVDQAIKIVSNPEGLGVPKANDMTLPIDAFFKASKGIGHINLAYDMDGTARRERLLYEYRGLFIPSYTIKMAAEYLNLSHNKMRAVLGSAVYLGSIEIPTTWGTEMMISFKGPRGSFKNYSFFDVINDKVPASVFKNKLVLVSASASGIMNPLSTPTDPTMSVGELSANSIWSILNKKFIQQPSWGSTAELLMILVLGLVIAFVLPRLKAGIASFVFLALLIVLAGGSVFFFVSQGLWVWITYPLLQLVLGYIGVVSIKYFVTETRKEKVEGESAETNRMLGLSFQGQGMLDMAFDKFRRVPVNDEMKDILYNLALDYERKRQYNKAASVFEYIEDHDAKFKDVAERKKKLVQTSETMVFGDGFLGGASAGDSLLSGTTGTRPTLGRYEVIKQLGKGAMGIVYLGQDPRINRTTAIKTVRFTDDFEPEEAEKMKAAFFREAESAGTLSHPNIVTIYDAGDEQDLAYIAMEFLEGEDLDKLTKKGRLLPMRKVIDYIADISDALDYAHQKGIVHRDIKPANIMLLKSGIVKITDFGIARISATSQTQTGVVKGTPYYMSPEQFAGEKVDGRSDIFSVGVMLFQMLTGELPFRGDNPMALMNQIMNVPHPDPRKFNPKIVKPLVTIIDKTLGKDRKKRYQKASQLRDHLRGLGKKIDAVMAKKSA